MGCACKGNRQKFEVVADGGAGGVVFTASVRATADAYVLREKRKNPASTFIVREQQKNTAAPGARKSAP